MKHVNLSALYQRFLDDAHRFDPLLLLYYHSMHGDSGCQGGKYTHHHKKSFQTPNRLNESSRCVACTKAATNERSAVT